ncbi:MAG: hypothetical protein Q4G62_03790 [Pseudomonadota bacterium]|nr:hypothetical protein [Pseudomonadota bacterium]
MQIPSLPRNATVTASRWCLAIIFSMLLASCQMVHFSVPPTTAATGCDRALIGAWSSNLDSDKDKPVDLDIDTDCRVQLSENGRAGSPVQLHVAEWPGSEWRVVWLRIGDLPAMFASQSAQPLNADDPLALYPDDWMLLCYRTLSDKLYLRLMDPDFVKTGITQDWLRGEIIGSGHRASLRIHAALANEPLVNPEIFCAISDDVEPMFTRTTGATP